MLIPEDGRGGGWGDQILEGFCALQNKNGGVKSPTFVFEK